jgi:hypothetical protein
VDEQGIYFPLLGISELKLYAGNKVFQKGYAILIITNLMLLKQFVIVWTLRFPFSLWNGM